MKTKLITASSIILTILSYCFTSTGWCEEPMRGPLPDEQQDIIHYMAEHHNELRRTVELRKDGYEASTVTENKELAEKLKEHFAYMQKRLGSGAMVRRWDPAFVELVEYHDQLTTKVEILNNGLKIIVTGKTPEAIKVAQNHASIVTGFTKEGDKAVSREHKTALGKDKSVTKPENKDKEDQKVKVK
jgi:hypothetical protein